MIIAIKCSLDWGQHFVSGIELEEEATGNRHNISVQQNVSNVWIHDHEELQKQQLVHCLKMNKG